MNPIRNVLRDHATKFLETERSGVDGVDSLTALLYDVRRDTLLEAGREADRAANERPANRFEDDPLAAYRAGGHRAAWRVRDLIRRDP